MGVPLYHPFLDGIFPINQPFWGTPILGNPHVPMSREADFLEVVGLPWAISFNDKPRH